MSPRSAPRRMASNTLLAVASAIRASLVAHWRSLAGLLAILAISAAFLGLLGTIGALDLPFIVRRWNSLWNPAWLAVSLTTTAFLLGFGTALPMGLVRAYLSVQSRRVGGPRRGVPFRTARTLWGTARALRVTAAQKARSGMRASAYGVVTGYVEAVRGTPFYVQMFLVFYFILGTYASFPLSVQSSFTFFFNALGYPPVPEQFYVAGLLALYLNTAGYQAEVLRAGFQSVGQGQAEAARAIGMRSRQIFRHITLPQALRLVVLPMTNEWIALFKATAILSTWPILEILLQSEQLGVNEGHPLEAFIMLAAMYLLVNVTLGKGITYVERKTRIPGLGTPAAATKTLPRVGRGRPQTR